MREGLRRLRRRWRRGPLLLYAALAAVLVAGAWVLVRPRSVPADVSRDYAEYRAGLANCDRTLLVTSHEAFGWLAARYGLQQRGIAGFSPENEPDPRQFAELSDLARRKHVTTIFTESLVSPKIAETLAREAGGLRTDVLNPIEGLTDRQRRAGDDYFTLMRANLRKLRRALGCP